MLQTLPSELTTPVLQIRLVEANMAKTAVGLFENPGSVDEVVRDLVASGFPQNDIRVLGEPDEMAGRGVMSIPHTDFEMDLIQELRTIGAAEADAEAYVEGVRRGGVMVFATGSGEKADEAVGIMNRHRAVEIGELRASEPHLPGTHRDDQLARGRNSSVQVGRFRSSGGGARLFVW